MNERHERRKATVLCVSTAVAMEEKATHSDNGAFSVSRFPQGMTGRRNTYALNPISPRIRLVEVGRMEDPKLYEAYPPGQVARALSPYVDH